MNIDQVREAQVRDPFDDIKVLKITGRAMDGETMMAIVGQNEKITQIPEDAISYLQEP